MTKEQKIKKKREMKIIYRSQIKTKVTFQRETLLFKSANNFTNLKQVKKQLNHVHFN